QAFDRFEQQPSVVAAAQTRLPGPGRSMEDGGDAVGDGLAVAIEQRHVDRKIDAGTRHHLPLERIAVQIDNAGKHQKIARIDVQGGASIASADVTNFSVDNSHRGFDDFAAEQGAAALDEDVSHDVAFCRERSEPAVERGSYLPRKSSTEIDGGFA